MDLVQTLDEPWGFGVEVVANQRQLRRRVWDLNIPLCGASIRQGTNQEAWTLVFYYDVFLAFVETSAEKVHSFAFFCSARLPFFVVYVLISHLP